MAGGAYMAMRADFCDTQAARQVRLRFGYEGFFAYVKLLCMMLTEPDGKLAYSSDFDKQDIAMQLDMTVDELGELVAVLEHYHALEKEQGSIWSPEVSQGIASREVFVERAKKAASARWEKDA